MSCQLASAFCATGDHCLVATSAINNGHVGPTAASSSPPSGLTAVKTVGQSSTLKERPSLRSTWRGDASTSAVGASSTLLAREDEDRARRLARWSRADLGSESPLAATMRCLRRQNSRGGTRVSVCRSGDGNHHSSNGGVYKPVVGRNFGEVSPKNPLSPVHQVAGQSRRREALLTTTRALTDDTFWISALQATVVAVGTAGMAAVSGFALREGLKRELEREAREVMLMEEAGMDPRSWRRAQIVRELGGQEEEDEGGEESYADDMAGYADGNENEDQLPTRRRRRNRPVQRE